MSRRREVLGLGILLVVGFVACSDPARQTPRGTVAQPGEELETATVTYRGRGIVRALNPAGLTITIEHDGIAGFMPAAAVISFPVASAELFEGIDVDDLVEFVIEHNPAGTKIVELSEAALLPPPPSP